MATNSITPGSSTSYPSSLNHQEAISGSQPIKFPNPISTYSTSTLRSSLSSSILSTNKSKATITNWGRTFQSKPDRIFNPKDVDQCLALVELARREFKTLRAVGRAHSPSDLMMTDDWAVRMSKLQGVIQVSKRVAKDEVLNLKKGKRRKATSIVK